MMTNTQQTKSSEKISFNIITFAGAASSYAFSALQAAKDGDFAKADQFMQQSRESSKLAHKAQSDLLHDELNGNPSDVNVLLVHAQDHLMQCNLAQELIDHIITLYKDKYNRC